MNDTTEPRDAPDNGSADWSGPADRDADWDDGPPGQPLTVLVFGCDEHHEEKVVDYYDPDDPPRCSRGDLMIRKRR
jgi:hypothetical protein